jgi:hypothetical protein
MADESFEYDEDTEASDESFEADESLEAAGDESFESDEDVGEADEAVFEASDGEGIDELDGEADEAIDEAVEMSASARLRADQDKNRRAEWARQIAADQRVEAQRAASTQRSITERLRSIQVQGAPTISTVGSLRGAGVVTATLPNGRRSQMRIIPTLAAVSEVNRLRTVVISNERRQAVATRNNARAISSLASAQAAAVRKLTDQQVKSDKDLSRRVVEGDNRLDRRITKELSGGTGILDKHGKRMMRVMRRQRQRALWNNITLATSAPLFAAYGEKENPIAKNNAILTGSLAFWLLSDEVVDALSGRSQFAKGGANFLSYAAPFANIGTVMAFLHNKQHERYISGFTDVPIAGAKVSLINNTIKKRSIDDFKGKTHTVVANIVGAPPAVAAAATVRGTIDNDGFLSLIIDPAPAAAVKVAWIVDTKPPVTVNP